jgi:hypothetical protein
VEEGIKHRIQFTITVAKKTILKIRAKKGPAPYADPL